MSSRARASFSTTAKGSPGSAAPSKPRISTGSDGTRRRHLFITLVDERPDHGPRTGSRHDDIATLEGASLDQNGRHGAATAIELGFDHYAFRGSIRVGLEVHDLSLKQNGFDEVVEARLLKRRNFDGLSFTTQAFDHDLVLEQVR